MIDSTIVARVIATTALAFGLPGSAAVHPAADAQSARCPAMQRDVLDADVIRAVPAPRARTIWI